MEVKLNLKPQTLHIENEHEELLSKMKKAVTGIYTDSVRT